MTWTNWIPAFVTMGALAAVFDEKLENLKSELRKDEEKLRAELQTRGAEIEGLRSGAFVNFTARQAELGRRRLLAVERVWAEVTELAKYRHLSTFAQTLNVDEIIKATSKSTIDRQKMSDFATMLLGNLADPTAQQYESTATKERPFVPDLTFALFMSYRQVVLWPYMLFQSMRLESDLNILKTESIVEVARKALPHRCLFLDEHGVGGVPFLVDELEAAVLASLRSALEQKDADDAAFAQAKAINDAVSVNTKPAPVDPPKLEG